MEDAVAAVAVELVAAALAVVVVGADMADMVVDAADRRNFPPTKFSCSVRSRVRAPCQPS